MLTAMGDIMRKAHDLGWITTRDGNISLIRNNSSILYITPSGVRKTIIHPEQIEKIYIDESGKLLLTDKVNPSGELEMHWKLQELRKGTMAIVHLHPTHIVAAMYKGWDLQQLASEFPEVNRYTRVGPNVSKLPAISSELASETFVKMTNNEQTEIIYDVVGQAQHGVCAIGKNPWDAFEHIERLEHICQIALLSGRRPNDIR